MSDLMAGLLIGFAAGALTAGAICYFTRARQASADTIGPEPYPEVESEGTQLLDQLLDETETGESLRQNLRVKYLHNEERIDDAIAVERKRAPQASEVELMRAAIERWERDNR